MSPYLRKSDRAARRAWHRRRRNAAWLRAIAPHLPTLTRPGRSYAHWLIGDVHAPRRSLESQTRHGWIEFARVGRGLYMIELTDKGRDVLGEQP